jgi:plasmid maintenance system antidote protein VapI
MKLKELINKDLESRKMNVKQYADLMDMKPRKLYRILKGETKPSMHLQLLTLMSTDVILLLKIELANELTKKFESKRLKPYRQRLKENNGR